MERRLGSTSLALSIAGLALFIHGVLRNEDSSAFLGIALAVTGVLVAIASVIRARRKGAASLVAGITMIPLALVLLIIWLIAHETT